MDNTRGALRRWARVRVVAALLSLVVVAAALDAPGQVVRGGAVEVGSLEK